MNTQLTKKPITLSWQIELRKAYVYTVLKMMPLKS